VSRDCRRRSLLVLAVTGCGCTVSAPAQEPAGRSDVAALAATGDGVQLALAQLRGGPTEVNYEQLLATGVLAEPQVQTAQRLSRELREGLSAAVGRGIELRAAAQGVVRLDSQEITADIEPLRLAGGAGLPFSVVAGARIEYARVFADRQAADAAPGLGLRDLPVSAEQALRLAPGTFVAIPVRARVALDASGSFLQRAFALGAEVGSFLSTSTTGALSAVAQGALVAEGHFQLQVVRLDGALVRLRVIAESDRTGSAAAAVRGAAAARYLFVPASTLERVRSLKERLAQLSDPARRVLAAARQRVQSFRDRLPRQLEALFPAAPEAGIDPQRAELEALARARVDEAVALAERVDLTLERLDRAVLEQAERAAEAIDAAGVTPWNRTVDEVRRHGSRSFDLSAAVELGADFHHRLRAVGDYLFDLRSEEARRAFEHAVSGRAMWLGAAPALAGWRDLAGSPLADLTLAEALARADQEQPTRRVQRLATALGDLRERHFGISFAGLFMKSGFERHERENRVDITDGSGRRESRLARLWQFDHEVVLPGDVDRISLSSGFVTPTDTDDPARGAYWFRWRRTFGAHHPTPVQDALATVLNLAGTPALVHGVPGLYAGEYEGMVDAELVAAIHGAALRDFFDPARASDALLWQALGRTAATFDNQFGLPYLATPARPDGLERVEGAVQACEAVASAWGGQYCFAFQEQFLAQLEAARQARDPVERLRFFEQFYRRGFLFNQIGSQVLIRYMAEVMHLLGHDDELYIKLAVRNRQDDSAAASPALETGAAPELDVAESIGLAVSHP
jgi:hypothetical protein